MAVDFVISISAKIGEYLLAPIGRQLGYLLCYNRTIEDFKRQVENLETERAGIQRRVDAAERNGEDILPNVQTWLTSVNEIIEESINFFDVELTVNKGCFNGHCPDLKLRYQLSRKAKKKTAVVDELERRRHQFFELSFPAPPPVIGSTSAEDPEVFESRKLIVKEIMEALNDDHINMIGIQGMGGVGKTVLVKEVCRHAKDDNLFDKVVMTVVSQTTNLRRIQSEIADMLGLKFDEESDSGRAKLLFARIMDMKRILVILDDIWDTVELEAIGIPFGAKHKGCKIVLTSRRQDVCIQMGTQKNFSIELLTEQEAWNLFRKIVGDSVDSPDLLPLAVEISKECAGLPLAIVTIARALKNKSLFDWRDAANQLRKSIPSNRVFSALEMTFNHLESEESKSFFLLCSLFPEASDIAIEDLLKYGIGLGLFQDVDTVDEARQKAHELIYYLKSSFLLIDSTDKECVKMHDVVRDVAITIASKDKQVFLVRSGLGCKEWPTKDTYEPYTAISLMSNDIHELPDGLECPKLQILLLNCSHHSLQFPNNFFLMMKNLKVLNMSDMHFLSLPPSLLYLENLRTLCLDRCSLKDISIIRGLKKLEILSFLGSNIKELPKEIGMLTHLRLLELTQCEELTIIPPDVIRGLSQLEELYMLCSFDKWELERQDKERRNASLAELKHLSRLINLETHISDANLLPEDLLLENLLRFKISMGTRFRECDHYSYSRILKLKPNIGTPLKDGVKALLKTAEHLHLTGMKNSKNVLYDLGGERFPYLKGLNVEECDEVEYIFNAIESVSNVTFPILEKLDLSNLANLTEICHGQLPSGFFFELQELRLCGLPGLISILSMVAFPNLEKLHISSLINLKQIWHNQLPIEERHAAVMLSRLRELKLWNLPQLLHVWKKYPHGTLSLRNLCSLDIHRCDSLSHVFSPSIARGLVQLQRLKIDSCEMMKVIIGEQGEGGDGPLGRIYFPQLHTLELEYLPNLTTFCQGNYLLDFSSLVTLSITSSHKIKAFTALGCLSTQKPEGLEETEGDNGISIQSLFNEKAAFPTLEKFLINGVEILKEMWPAQLSAKSSRVLEVKRDHKVLNAVPFDWLPFFEVLIVEDCDLVEEVVELEGLVAEEVHVTGLLSQLRILRLRLLPKLKHLWWDKYPHGTLGFQNLSSIYIYKCNSLKSLFSPSIASSLMQLLEVQIDSCEMMGMIIVKEGEEENCIEVVFPQLHTLELRNLPELVSFCSGNYNFELPSLETMSLVDCPKMQTFSTGFISTPKLKIVTIETLKGYERGNLITQYNTYSMKKGKLKSDIFSRREVEEEEERGEKVIKKFEEADEVEKVEREENASAQAIQHEILELVEEEA